LPAGAWEFFERLPRTFYEANLQQWELYEETLYAMRRPVTHGNYHFVQRFVGMGNPSAAAFKDRRVYGALNDLLAGAVYPDASPITQIERFAEGSSEFASALLHFNNMAYPIYDAASVGGLHRIGYMDVQYVSTIEGDTVGAYQRYIDAIQELKETIPFEHVPEKNYYLTRIIQETLWRVGMDAPATEARDRPRPTLR
jgi:hypothetical protein